MCDEPKCEAKNPAYFVLQANGSFAFKVRDEGWQIAPNQSGVIMSLCPLHVRTVERVEQVTGGPRGGRIIQEAGH
jgi:hypothetical protein